MSYIPSIVSSAISVVGTEIYNQVKSKVVENPVPALTLLTLSVTIPLFTVYYWSRSQSSAASSVSPDRIVPSNGNEDKRKIYSDYFIKKYPQIKEKLCVEQDIIYENLIESELIKERYTYILDHLPQDEIDGDVINMLISKGAKPTTKTLHNALKNHGWACDLNSRKNYT